MSTLVRGLAAIVLAACVGAARPDDGVDWVRDFEAGMRAAREQERAVLLYVGRPGSEADRILEAEVFADARFVAATRKVVAIRVERGIAAAKPPGDTFLASGDASDVAVLAPDGAPIAHVIDRTGRTLSAATWAGIVADIAARYPGPEPAVPGEPAEPGEPGEGERTLVGRLEGRDVEGGAFVLVTARTTYCLHGDLRGLPGGEEVVVCGRPRPDLACSHMVGVVFEVTSIQRARR